MFQRLVHAIFPRWSPFPHRSFRGPSEFNSGQFILMNKKEENIKIAVSHLGEKAIVPICSFLDGINSNNFWFNSNNLKILDIVIIVLFWHLTSSLHNFNALILFKFATFSYLYIDFIFRIKWDLSEAAIVWSFNFSKHLALNLMFRYFWVSL